MQDSVEAAATRERIRCRHVNVGVAVVELAHVNVELQRRQLDARDGRADERALDLAKEAATDLEQLGWRVFLSLIQRP